MLKAANLGVRFLLELGALGAFGYWGATTARPMAVRVAAAIAGPLAASIFWGIFVSPKAQVPTGLAGRAGLGLLVFGVAAAALAARGRTSLAVAYFVCALVSTALLVVWRQ